jgi:hypothetical protein
MSIASSIGERIAIDELQHQRAASAIRPVVVGNLLEAVDCGNVRMAERGENARLALEAHEPFGVARERRRQELQRNVPAQAGIVRVIDLAHAAGTEKGTHLEAADSRRPGRRPGVEDGGRFLLQHGVEDALARRLGDQRTYLAFEFGIAGTGVVNERIARVGRQAGGVVVDSREQPPAVRRHGWWHAAVRAAATRARASSPA